MPYTGGYRPAARLAFDDETYTPIGARSLSEKAIRKEYSRLRSIARKRIERFEGTEWTDTSLYKEHEKGFKTLRDIQSRTDLNRELVKVARFVTQQRSKVSGLEKERRTGVKTLREHGYKFVNKENYREFADFMEYSRNVAGDYIFDSKQVATQYKEAKEQGAVTEQQLEEAFDTWKTQQIELEKVQNRNQKGARVYRQALD